jgi:hypothetical protein
MRRGPEPSTAVVEAIVAEIEQIEREPDRMKRQVQAARFLAMLDNAAARLSHSNRM